MNINKTTKYLSILGLAFLMSACNTELCSDEPDDASIGRTAHAEIFKGAAQNGKVCHVDAYKLEADEDYSLDRGLLYIRGNLPNDISVSVKSGKIVVDGNLGQNNKLSADVPIDTHTETESSICLLYNASLKMNLPTTCHTTKTYIDGYTYPNDRDPSIIINGHANTGTTLSGNSGFYIRDKGDTEVKLSQPEYASIRAGVDTGSLYKKGYHVAPLLSL
tara:strand:+ start:304837 stop:305493 length:657 start_codon:yes stop_codon:yes gene_type:complete